MESTETRPLAYDRLRLAQQPPPPLPGTRVTGAGRMPMRHEIHPRVTVINWRAIGCIAFAAVLSFLLGMAVMLGVAKDLLIEDGVSACAEALVDDTLCEGSL